MGTEEIPIELQDMAKEAEWVSQLWPRKTPAEQVRERREANLVGFTNMSKGESTNPLDARRSGTSEGTRLSRRSATARHALTNFIPGTYTGKSQRSPSAELAPHQQERVEDAETLAQVRTYNAYRLGKESRWHWFLDCLPYRTSKPPKPDNNELLAIARRAFPPRMELPVLVCDIHLTKQEDGEPFLTTVGNIEKVWQEKPKDVLIRWIHAPLGVGFLHSSIEELFRAWRPMGREFKHAGSPGFEYLDNLESIHFRDRDDIQHLRNVIRDLRPDEELATLLNKDIFVGDKNEKLQNDMEWRINDHFGDDFDFWNLAKSDFPLELSERIVSSDDGPLRAEFGGEGPLDGSVLATRVPQYQGAHVLVAPFRIFHRQDGFVLTMSASTGVDALHKDFHSHLRATLRSRLGNRDSSTVANSMLAFCEKGAENWREHTMEYFLTLLAAEIGIGPQNHTGGLSAVSLCSAFQTAVQNLKQRRYDPWEEKKTLTLVKEHLICMDQLRALSVTFARRILFFENLRKDLDEIAAEDLKRKRAPKINNPNAETSQSRIDWALSHCHRNKNTIDLLLDDITRSVDTLHQLQTLNQNEMQIVSHRTNKALVVITSVTVVFLPLGFFCSYFGMNFEDIRDTRRTQDYFWKVCGSLTLAIVILVLFVAYRHNVLFDLYKNSAEMMRQRRERRRQAPPKILPK